MWAWTRPHVPHVQTCTVHQEPLPDIQDVSVCVCVCITCTGDWKIDETPIDGQEFDRSTFDLLSEYIARHGHQLSITAPPCTAMP